MSVVVKSLIKHKSLIREISLYGVIGGIAASTDGIVFYFLSKSLNMYVSNFVSINLGITISFLLNIYVNFKVHDRVPQRACCFFTVGYAGLTLSMIILYIGVEVANLPKMDVKILSVFFVAAVQFTLNKLITFKKVELDGQVVHGYPGVQ